MSHYTIVLLCISELPNDLSLKRGESDGHIPAAIRNADQPHLRFDRDLMPELTAERLLSCDMGPEAFVAELSMLG